MSVQQLLWALVVVLLLIAGWQFVRALRLGRSSKTKTATPPAPAPKAAAVTVASTAVDTAEDDDDEDDEDGFDYAPQLRPVRAPAPAPAPSPAPVPAGDAAPDAFQSELRVRHLRREIEGQNTLIARQRAEIDMLQAEVASLRQQLEDMLLSHQSSTSPEYSEALLFAEQGHSAEEIAARCGITVAEAGLVLSLTRTGGVRT